MWNSKKVFYLSQWTKQQKFKFIKENSSSYDVLTMCKILKMSRSGYYKYLSHTPSKREIENEAIKEYIQDIHSQFKQCYGYHRIKCELDARGIIVNHKRVYRLMKECNISEKHPRKKHGNYKKVKEELIKENLLIQNFSVYAKTKLCLAI